MHVGVLFLGIAILISECSFLIHQKENINDTQPSKVHATKPDKTALKDTLQG